MSLTDFFLNEESADEAWNFFQGVLRLGINFKLQDQVLNDTLDDQLIESILEPLPLTGAPLSSVLDEFKSKLLDSSINVASRNFMGFPYAGNSIAAIGGAILDDFMQQNLMSDQWSPSATFAELTVLQWLREIVGYPPGDQPHSVDEVGGIITYGGTLSNTIALLLARENHRPGTLRQGVSLPEEYQLVVPEGITHYTVLAAQQWCGCGSHVVEVKINPDFRMDLDDLRVKLARHQGQIMGVVAFAGDSKTMTIDHLQAIAETVKSMDENIWLHADACHGFCLGYSQTLRPKLRGLSLFDSVSADPHKVLNVPYPLSALLVKSPDKLKLVTGGKAPTEDEKYSFNRLTPFLATRSWMSLRLWFLMKHLGASRIGQVIETRYEMAQFLADQIRQDDKFLLLNDVDAYSVVFFYTGGKQYRDIVKLNEMSENIQKRLLEENGYSLHRPKIIDPGLIERGRVLRPLRYMSGNPNVTQDTLLALLAEINRIGAQTLGR